MKKNPKKLISIIAPVYNEEKNLGEFIKRLSGVMNATSYSYEIIFINDGSRDNSLELLKKSQLKLKQIKIIDLSRNFGKEAAMTCGIDHAAGDAIVPIDTDLQDPPELIRDFLEKWESGFDVVYAKRIQRKGESVIKKITAHLFYKFFQRIVRFKIPVNTGDYRLMDRKAVEGLKQLREKNRFMKGLFSWVGFRQTGVEYIRDSRYMGKTSWNYFQLFGFAMDGITSFSAFPLKLVTFTGFACSGIAMMYAFYMFMNSLLFGNDVKGYPSLIVIMLFMGGIQLLSIGLIGEYLGRLYTEIKDRPIYLVQEMIGFGKRK